MLAAFSSQWNPLDVLRRGTALVRPPYRRVPPATIGVHGAFTALASPTPLTAAAGGEGRGGNSPWSCNLAKSDPLRE